MYVRYVWKIQMNLVLVPSPGYLKYMQISQNTKSETHLVPDISDKEFLTLSSTKNLQNHDDNGPPPKNSKYL